MGGVRTVGLALVGLVILAGCTAAPPSPQRSGPLEIRFVKAGARGGAYPVPPQGLEWFAGDVKVVNTTDATVAVRFKEGQLDLYQGSTPIGGQGEGTSSTAAEASGRGFDETSSLPPHADVYVSRNFLITPGQRGLTLVYRLPGYGEFKWRVR